MPCVNDQRWHTLQDIRAEFVTIDLRPKDVGWQTPNLQQLKPFVGLGFVGNNLGMKLAWNSVYSNAVVCLRDELLFEPEFLLKVLKLSKEINELMSYATDRLRLGEILIDARCGL